MFGLAAIAALMAMALVGASSAMAGSTTLCKKDATPCPTKEIVSSIHEVSVGKAKLLSTFLTVECDVLFSGTSLGTASPIVIHGNFTYTNCGSCTVTETSTSVLIKVLRTSHETAEVTGEGEVFVDCGGSSLECEYDGENLKGTGKGPLLSAQSPDNGEVSLQGQEVHKTGGGFFCPATSKLDIVTSPLVATSIVEGKTMDCVSTSVGQGSYTTDNGTTCSGEVALGTTGTFELVGG